MLTSSQFTATERFESFKAAALGGACAGLVSLLTRLFNRFWIQNSLAIPSFTGLAGLTLLINLAIAALSGSLFAITYRYAIRQDQNPQLNIGVVLAFTLTRGLAQVDAGSAIAQNFWPFLSACGESFLIFAAAAGAIALANRLRWISRFGSETEG